MKTNIELKINLKGGNTVFMFERHFLLFLISRHRHPKKRKKKMGWVGDHVFSNLPFILVSIVKQDISLTRLSGCSYRCFGQGKKRSESQNTVRVI